MAATAGDLKELMMQIGMDKKLADGLDPALPLAGQGVDSVDCPAFAVALEAKYNVKISDTDSMKLRTINDFVAFVNR